MKTYLLLSVFLLSSCATANNPPIIDSSKRIDISGVSVLPPQEGGWVLLHLSTYQVALAKKGNASKESVVIDVSLNKLPKFNSEEEFLTFVKQSRANEPETGRFKLISNNESLTNFKGNTCAKFKTSSEDHAAKTGKGISDNMLLNSLGYICIHPRNKTVGVKIEYSLRQFPESDYGNIEKNTVTFFNNIKFTEF